LTPDEGEGAAGLVAIAERAVAPLERLAPELQRAGDELRDVELRLRETLDLVREGRELVVDLGSCTCCGRCLELAGEAAAPSGAFLLATGERSTLVKRVPIRGDREALR